MASRIYWVVGVLVSISACQPAVRTAVPLEEASTGNWLVSIAISDDSFLWALDTGARFSLVDPMLLERIPAIHQGDRRLAPRGFALSGFSEDDQPYRVELVTLKDYRLANARIVTHDNVALADLSHIRHRGLEIYGVLGLDALVPRPFTLDPCALELTLLDKPPRRYPRGTELQVQLSHDGAGLLAFELTVDGQPEKFLLDTGANYSSMTPDTVARVFGDRPPDRLETRPVSSILQTREYVSLEIFRSRTVQFAGETLSGVDFRRRRDGPGNLMGMDVISRFEWYIDLNSNVAVVKPRPKFD